MPFSFRAPAQCSNQMNSLNFPVSHCVDDQAHIYLRKLAEKIETKQMNPQKKKRKKKCNVACCHELSSLFQIAGDSGARPELSLQLQLL